MSRTKGTQKTGGRSAGTPNKVTTELKTWVQQLIDGNRETLESDLMMLDPVDRWRIVEKLMSYVVPKMQSIEAKLEFDQLTDEQIDSLINGLTKDIVTPAQARAYIQELESTY
ncbi:MAG: hypothetical protein RR499_03890 [Mucinivorans sp.]